MASQPIPGVAEIFPNLYNASVGPLLRQLYLRQALEYLINRHQIVTEVFHGYADPGNGPVPLKASAPFVSPLERSRRAVPVLAVEGHRPVAGTRLEGGPGRHVHLPAPGHLGGRLRCRDHRRASR